MKYEKSNSYDDKYFASKPAEDTASNLLSRSNSWYNELDTNGYLDKVRMMWAAYHGAYFSDFEDGHSLSFSGEQGELVNMAVNHLGNIATNMLTMITATRPAMRARASNSDHKSLVQAKLANGLLDYYMREKRMEDYIRKAAEYAIVLGSGYVKMEWNATTGEIYDYEEDFEIEYEDGQPVLTEDGQPIIKLDENGDPVIVEESPLYTGDVEFSNLSPFDVVFDASREDQKHDWVLCRTQRNRFDLAAKYPELENEILAAKPVTEIKHNAIDSFSYTKTDNIFVYEFYHKKTESMPEGRYMMFVSPQAVLIDSPMPYRDLPVFRIAYRDILGTPFGYTPLFDILPIQDAINSLHSTVLTNQSAFGVQNIGIPVGANVSISELSGGLNIIEFDPQAGPPVPLNFTQTPPEVFEYLNSLIREAEVISGVNSVARGNPESSLKSGTALALVQSMSIQYMSGLQQSYVRLVEDIGTSLINMLRDFAEVPRVATITGIRNTSHMKHFTGDDLSEVNRVIVEVANPLSNTTAGRMEMAQELLQMGAITSVEQYSTVMNTGRLDLLTEGQEEETLTIQKENEFLLTGQPVISMITDDHANHIRAHKSVLADPELRKDPELVQRVQAHLQEHINLLRSADPDLLAIIGQQPLSPPGGSPANQPQQPPGDANMQGVTPGMTGPPQQQAPAPGMPNMPTPPPPFDNLPSGPQGDGQGG